MLNSRAVLSSGLWEWGVREGKGEIYVMIDVHLPATEDEALLWRRDARLLLDFLLDSGDLKDRTGILSMQRLVRMHAAPYLVVEIDVELNLGRKGELF
jgi:hypothetical protein